MKKLLSFILAAAMLLGFVGCKGKNSEKLKVFFKDRVENSLNEETRVMKTNDKTTTEDRAKFLIAQIIQGPLNEKNRALISKKAQLLSFAINDGVATVNMSKEFSSADGVNALLLRLSFVNTLCALDGINGIVIQVDGKPIVSDATGKEVGVMSPDDIALDTDDKPSSAKSRIVLYFPKKGGEKLVRETREVELQNALSIEKTVISELLKGPTDSDCTNAVPTETKLLGIETKDNVCFVNFSNEFVTKTSPGSLSTTLALYSVVNSLCDLPGVKAVQILVNGENGVEFGNYVLDIPYEADLSITE